MEDMEQRTLSDIICDNTIIEKVQERALEIPNPVTNPIRVCQRAAGAEGGLGSEVVTTASVTAAPETTQPPTLPPAPVSLQQRVPMVSRCQGRMGPHPPVRVAPAEILRTVDRP